MPFPVAVLRWQVPLTALDGLAVFIYVVAGPLVGLLAFCIGFGSLGSASAILSAYLFGLGPAATCAGLSLLASRRLARPWHRLAAAPAVGIVSGLVGIVPFLVLMFGVTFRAEESWFLGLALGFSVGLSLVAATLCTAVIELVRYSRG